MANQNSENPSGSTTERVQAPATVKPAQQWIMPRQKQIERTGGVSAAMVRFFPQVRGGICEFCGVIDGNYPSNYQYKMCPHYRGMQLRCSYCPESKDADDVIDHSVMIISEHPDNPDTLVVRCNSYECSQKHERRFKRNS